jgi:argininosuccinate lyase
MSARFGFIDLPDRFCTGSSIMPQKKNPDVPELIRGKTGRITGALVSLLTTLKGLPTSYQRDLQEDKEALFSANDQVADMVAIAEGVIATTQFRDDKLRALASNPALLATEAADYLVRKGVPFRQAHDLVGKLLREAEKQGKNWIELPLAELQKISPEIGSDFAKSLTVEASLAAKKVPGGTSLESVRAAIADLEKRIRGIGATK